MQKSKVSDFLKPLKSNPIQAYFGKNVFTLGLTKWVLEQTGEADVFVSSYSTSEEFLRGFYLLKKNLKIRNSSILTDLKASKKTVRLNNLMKSCFDDVFFGENHSKLLLFKNDNFSVSIVTSMNQTYGSRAESTVITTSKEVFDKLYNAYSDLTQNSMRYELQ